MKHIKTYKIFESKDSDIHSLVDLYQDFLDEFNITNKYDDSYGIHFYNNRLSLSITKNTNFGDGFKVTISGENIIKKGHYKGFGGVQNDKIRNELESIHERCMGYFGFKDCIVGSSYVHSGGFSIKYFTESPKYEFEEKSIDVNNLYSMDYYIRELPLLNGYIASSISSHSNVFDFYKNEHRIDGIFALWGGLGPSHYYNPISIMSGKDCDKYGKCIANSPIEQWVTDVWGKVCSKYRINKGRSSWNMSRSRNSGDVSTIEFMDILVDNQDSFSSYKSLPKVNN